jgi:alcohol dehydrogenase, propanol-preferring
MRMRAARMYGYDEPLRREEIPVPNIESDEVLLAAVGLIGQRVELPLFPFVSGEKSYFGSFRGDYNDLTEVLSLADEGLIKHNINPVKLDDINDNLAALRHGDVVGRLVIVYD